MDEMADYLEGAIELLPKIYAHAQDEDGAEYRRIVAAFNRYLDKMKSFDLVKIIASEREERRANEFALLQSINDKKKQLSNGKSMLDAALEASQSAEARLAIAVKALEALRERFKGYAKYNVPVQAEPEWLVEDIDEALAQMGEKTS